MRDTTRKFFVANMDMGKGTGSGGFFEPATTSSTLSTAGQTLTQKDIENGITLCTEPHERDYMSYYNERNPGMNDRMVTKSAQVLGAGLH